MLTELLKAHQRLDRAVMKLYGFPLTMLPELLKAHQRLDRAVMNLYGFPLANLYELRSPTFMNCGKAGREVGNAGAFPFDF